MSVDEEQLKEAFRDQDIELEDALVKTCVRLCGEFRLSATSLALKWDAYSANGDCSLSEGSLKKFKAGLKVVAQSPAKKEKKFSKSLVQNSRPRPLNFDINSIDNLTRKTRTVEETYGLKPTNRDAEFRTPKKKSRSRMDMSPSVKPSPATGRYASRTDRGKLVQTLHNHITTDTTAASSNLPLLDIKAFQASDELSDPEKFRYMFEHDEDISDELEGRFRILEDRLLESVQKSATEDKMVDDKQEEEDEEKEKINFSSLASMSQGSEYYLGRICGEDTYKIHAGSIVLQGDRRISLGARVKLNFKNVEKYNSLFSGQIVAVKGKSDGMTLEVEEIFQDASPKPRQIPVNDVLRWQSLMGGQPLKVMVAAGPYFTDTLDYADSAFEDIVSTIKQKAPNIAILIGPFLSADHPLVVEGRLDETYEDAFKHIIDEFARNIGSQTATEVLLVPSTQDAFHPFVFPQPPFKRKYQVGQVKCLSNPTQFQINEVTFALTSHSIIKDLMTFSTHIGSGDMPKRMVALTEHLVKQQSLWPVFPPSSGANVDYSLHKHLQLQYKPDFVIWTGKFKYMAEEICDSSSIAINPGPIVKYGGGGTYAMITVAPLSSQQKETVSDEKGVRFKDPQSMCKRSRVDIIKI